MTNRPKRFPKFDPLALLAVGVGVGVLITLL